MNLLCSIWSSFQLTLLVMGKMKNVHPTMWNNVKSVWCCMMGRRGWQAETFQVPHVGGEDPASPQEAGGSSGQPQPWPAGLYPALPTVSALPGHSRAHQICLISGCGKIVYCKAGDMAELANPPECFYQHSVNMRHRPLKNKRDSSEIYGESKCPKAFVFAGIFCLILSLC